jgi:uncharacterized protein
MKFVDVSRIRSRFDESLLTRDGVRLSIDVYLPAGHGEYPVLITRTPYDNNRTNRVPGTTTLPPSPSDRFKLLAAHGFVVAACDVRGRGDSDGRFVPFVHEAWDGADTVHWARALPECNGHIGLFGSGYAAFSALSAAIEANVDAVAAWSPFGTDGTPFRGGALRLEWLFWMHLVGGRTTQPVDVPAWGEVFRHRPLISMHEALGRDDVPWREWLEGPSPLQPLDVEGRLPSLTAPTLFVTGWWDAALSTTVRQWDAAGGTHPDTEHALMIGPWDTEAVRHPRADVGSVAWGPAALIDADELLIEWFSAHLEGGQRPLRGARVFVTGRNAWITRETLAAADSESYWLASGGRANTRRGDGRLARSPCGDTPPDRFTYDPENPVPWQPGAEGFSRSSPKLVLDTAFATSRDDVLVYDSEPVQASVVICGRPTVKLWVATDARRADWVVAIEDVFPGGDRPVHLAHGIVQADGDHEPAVPVAVEIELTPVAHELLIGHALRLLVTSSLWPLYAVNLGGADYLHDTVSCISEQTLFHDSRYASTVELPLA